jgi:hypothetical protein
MNRRPASLLLLVLLALATNLALAQLDPQKPVDKATPKLGSDKLKPGGAVGLNPQPEPPEKAKLMLKPGEAQGFNPQPDPPGKSAK